MDSGPSYFEADEPEGASQVVRMAVPSLSVVIPAFNEASRLDKSVRTTIDYLNRERPGAELILVDDGSKDDTAKVAEEAFANAGSVRTRVIRNRPNRGKGN